MSDSALAGLRVLEIAGSVAASYCGRMLAGCGAEVIKVEPPGSGDPVRAHGPFPGDAPHLERSGHFLHLNTGKKSITLNLDTHEGAEVFKRLAASADAVIEDTPPGTMERRGLGPDTLEELNPGLVLSSVTPFGQGGPYRDLQTTELVTFALSGYMDLCGLPDREPIKAWGSLGEYVAGVSAAIATMSGLAARDRMGGGQHVDHSIMDSMMVLLGMTPFEYRYYDEVFKRAGNDTPGVDITYSMSKLLPCRDGYVQVHNGPPGMLTILTGEPMLEEKGHLRQEYDRVFSSWLGERDKKEVAEKAQEIRLPFTEVSEPRDLLSDPQHEARGVFEQIDHPHAGKVTQPGAPFKMSETPWVTTRAPLLGEHNDSIYRGELNCTDEEIAGMIRMGVL